MNHDESAAVPARGRSPLLARLERHAGIIRVVTLLVFVVLAVMLAMTRPPQSDEGHFASAGAAIASRGQFVMPMWTPWIPTLDVRVYSNMPLYFLTLGAWFKVFGVSWLAMRALSVVFGLLLVVSLASVLRSVARDRITELAGLVVVALNYDVINFSSARYDIMTAALSAAALAVYLGLRERSLAKALLFSNALLAAACMTHPYALFGMIGLAVFVLTLDARRLRVGNVALAAVPYVVALAAWGAYIMVDPEMFRSQFLTNASGRASGSMNPFSILKSEFVERYLEKFAGWGRGNVPLAMRVKILLLVAYAAGVAGCLAVARIRRTPAAKALVISTIAAVLLLAVVDRTRWYIYLIYTIPLLAACLGLLAGDQLREGGWRQHAVLGSLAAFALFSIASVGYRARLDVHHQAFLPAAQYLQANVKPGQLVMAGGEFGLGLGFERHVLDDPWLGTSSGKSPDYIVQSSGGGVGLRPLEPGDGPYPDNVARVLANYRPVFESQAGGTRYVVHAR